MGLPYFAPRSRALLPPCRPKVTRSHPSYRLPPSAATIYSRPATGAHLIPHQSLRVCVVYHHRMVACTPPSRPYPALSRSYLAPISLSPYHASTLPPRPALDGSSAPSRQRRGGGCAPAASSRFLWTIQEAILKAPIGAVADGRRDAGVHLIHATSPGRWTGG